MLANKSNTACRVIVKSIEMQNNVFYSAPFIKGIYYCVADLISFVFLLQLLFFESSPIEEFSPSNI